MNPHKQQEPSMVADTESSISDLLPYIQAAKDKFPSKEALFAEVNKERDSRKKTAKALQYTVALVFCGFGLWTMNPTISSETYTTRYAENAQFSLADGSLVHLNSNSALVTKFRLHSREMMLDKGEASFTVSHGLRPFSVAVNNSKIVDIGTVFNIAKWDQTFVTTVLEGEVDIHTASHVNRLTAGHSMEVTGSEPGAPYPANMDIVTAWQTGKIIFNQTPLKEAIASIQRYRKAPILLDQRVENMRITGIYDVNKIEPLLDSMGDMFPVKVTRRNEDEIKIQKN